MLTIPGRQARTGQAPAAPYRRYLACLLGPIAVMVLITAGLNLWLQPIFGDLTRVGGYLENDFGWRGVQERFDPPLAEPADLNRDYDILVAGDSFSTLPYIDPQRPPGAFWVDFLARETGRKVGVVSRRTLKLTDYLRGDSFRSHPPKAIIFELTEKEGPEESIKPDCSPAGTPGPPVEPMPAHGEPRPFARQTAASLDHYHSMAAIMQIANHALIRSTKAMGRPKVTKYQLTRRDLFSNKRPDQLLVLPADLLQTPRPEEQWQRESCQLLALQTLAEANGRTRFMTMIAPNKLTAYASWLAAPAAVTDGTEHYARTPGPRLIRVDRAIKAAIGAGRRDVYLPNDTHWGTAGARIAAETAARALAEP